MHALDDRPNIPKWETPKPPQGEKEREGEREGVSLVFIFDRLLVLTLSCHSRKTVS